MFWNLVLFAVSFVVSAILAPKPKLENARASKLSDFNFPRSEEGSAVPLVLGRGMLRGPNTLWFGDFEAIPITERVKTGLFKKKTVTTGHEYYVGLDLCFALGPVTLHKIVANEDKVLWSGTKTSRDTFASNVVTLGGRGKGGELSGAITFYPGGTDEPIDPYVAGNLPAEQAAILPAYRGFARCVFQGNGVEKVNAASGLPNMNPGVGGILLGLFAGLHKKKGSGFFLGESANVPPLAFECSMYPDPLALGAVNRIGPDINPASALYTVLSATWGGLGLSPGVFDLSTFTAAATTLYNEGHGMTLIAGQSDSGAEFVDEVLRQIDAVIYENASTRQIGLKLIRGDYDANTIPAFTDDETLEVVSYTRGFWDATHNEVRVNYTSPERNYQTATAFAQDMAAIARAGSVKPVEFGFPMCTNATLAQQLAQRELRQQTTPLIKCRLILNREAATLKSGDVFKYSNSEYGIAGLVLRVERIDLGTLEDGRIAIDAQQDIFGVGSLVFSAPVTGRYSPPTTAPIAVAKRAVVRAPRFLVERLVADGLVSSGDARILTYLAAKPSSSHLYFATETQDEITNSELRFADHAVLAEPVAFLDQTIKIASATFVPGTPESLSSGDGSILVNGTEWMQYTGATDNGDGTFTLAVMRGRYQTARQTHAVAAPVLVLDADEPPSDVEPRTESSVTVKLLPSTFTGTLAREAAPSDVVTFNDVNLRPNAPVITTPPATLASGATTVDLTWKARSDKGKTFVSIPSDPADPYPAGEFALARFYAEGGAASEQSFAIGSSSGTLNFGSLQDTTLNVELFGATGNGIGANRSIEFDLVRFVLPPSFAGDQYYPNVSYLSGFNGAESGSTFATEGPKSITHTNYGTPLMQAAGAKFGSTGLATNENNTSSDYVAIGTPTACGCDFGTGDFTIEGFAKSTYNDSTWYHALLGNYKAGVNGSWCFFLRNNPSNVLSFHIVGQASVVGTTDLDNTLFHFAVSRNGDTIRLFVNGVMEGKVSSYAGVSILGTDPVLLGGNHAGTNDRWRGFLDEIRITKGVGRYNADTPIAVPTAPYDRSGGAPFAYSTEELSKLTSSSAYAMKGNVFDVSTPCAITAVRAYFTASSSGLIHICKMNGTTVSALVASKPYTGVNGAYSEVVFDEPVLLSAGERIGIIVVRNNSTSSASAGTAYTTTGYAIPNLSFVQNFRRADTVLDVGDVNSSPLSDPWVIDVKGHATGLSTRWRINCTATGNGGNVTFTEAQFRGSAGGADMTSGGTASGSAEGFGPEYGASKAFDDSTGTTWVPGAIPAWLEYQFASKTTVREVAITARTDGTTYEQAPTQFDVQYWNGTEWVTSWSVTTTTFTSGQTKVFTKP